MVESLMLCKTLINNDLIISYADIFYDGNILRKLNKLKGNFLPVNKNWLNSGRKDMDYQQKSKMMLKI